MALKWENIGTEHSNYLCRAAVFGGWLIMSTDDVLFFNGENSHVNMQPGYQWRTSITFVPDPEYRWDLDKEYNLKVDRSIPKDLGK